MLKVLERVLETYAQDGHSQELWIHPASREVVSCAKGLGVNVRDWPLTDKLSLLDPVAFFSQRRLGDGLVFYHGFKSFLVANPRENPVILSLYNAVFPPWGTKGLRQAALHQAKSRVRNLLKVVVASHSQQREASCVFDNVMVIPSGVDTELFKPGQKEQIIGFLGRLRKEKGVDLLLHAAELFPDWKFELAGPDLDGYGKRVLPKNVQLLGVVQNPEKVICRWSIMVLPSYTEAMPLSVLEGLSCGLCVIGSDTGDVGHLLEGGQVGLAFPVGDREKFIEALRLATSDHALREEYGRRGREKAQEFDWSRVLDMWRRLLDEWR
ncbi:MAG: glycosyltransferase family 4 protein [Bacillota bacterium]|jgi:glycosyltransferase involved in cell wall biosynthesis|nr:glycosyltransferase family 4 protein [Bacillota bacterium]HOA90988.1 glycosyltransferase family 4 protein [Bacillota bacterium]HOL13050.1 glycosyltransferase family 4 protein [Bacillota bacterium]HOP54016.1 glycosyltransferase family 4 protein [Bacillota bacterium]HPT60823.1 glycosyltransferase family 4 protein [Bacillota bacterium]